MNYVNPFDSTPESVPEELPEEQSQCDTDREWKIQTLPVQRNQPDQMLISSDEEEDSGVNMTPGTSKSTVWSFRTPKPKFECNKENLGAHSCPPKVRASRLGERKLDAHIPTVHCLVSSDEEAEKLPRTPEKKKIHKRPRPAVDVKKSYEKKPFEETLENAELSSDDSGPPRIELTYCFVHFIFFL